jgi:hypothetical protein
LKEKTKSVGKFCGKKKCFFNNLNVWLTIVKEVLFENQITRKDKLVSNGVIFFWFAIFFMPLIIYSLLVLHSFCLIFFFFISSFSPQISSHFSLFFLSFFFDRPLTLSLSSFIFISSPFSHHPSLPLFFQPFSFLSPYKSVTLR